MFPTLTREHSPKYLTWAIAIICLSYLIFQLIYIPYAALSVDEFWFGHHIYEYTHKIPYRDFLPYKTVLGYYLLSIPMHFSHGLFEPLFLIKDEIAIINSLFIGATCWWLSKLYQPKAILLTVILIFFSQLFLIYSVDLRVDMLTCWVSFISVMLLLSNRILLAGLALGISFIISQKALWFFCASNIGLGLYWLVMARQWRIVRQIILFNVAVLAPIAMYLVIWAEVSNWPTVLNSVFYEGYTQAKITWYSRLYYICWNTILHNGPLLVLLWPFTWITFLVPRIHDAKKSQRFFVGIYAAILMLFIISYQQAFPYGMVFAVPVYFLIYADFFSWLITLYKEPEKLQTHNSRLLFWFISLYAIGVLSISIYIALSPVYYFILLIPAMIGVLLHLRSGKNNYVDSLKICLWVTILFVGLIYPGLRFILATYIINGADQQANVKLADNLLAEGGGYFAGTPLIYYRDQAIPGLRNLISPALEYLENPSKELLPIMISSLYLEPRTISQVLHDLQTTPVKFYVYNYRTSLLALPIRNYLSTHFMHYWGSIYIYAPRIPAKQQSFSLQFSGHYSVVGPMQATIILDGKKIRPHAVIQLAKGIHTSFASDAFRLQYMPNLQVKPNWGYSVDSWSILAKAIVM